ncbi:LamG-like jellyroll fold domain-containing protein [Paenibacillus sp. 22594]|uniref:LamG-like jellyroll fold domain-containing protein n=1 Tax=Paenibacillus sp. 22594 TaxID=3453947 RepID=UPI003F8705F1
MADPSEIANDSAATEASSFHQPNYSAFVAMAQDNETPRVVKAVYGSVAEAVYADRVFDLNFLDGKATDSSPAKLGGEVVGGVKIEYDSAVKKHVAVFNGESNNFIKIPFSQEQRDKVAKKFTLETVFKMNKIADMGVLMNTEGGGIGFESNDSGLMEIWAHIGGSYKRVGVQLEKDKYYHLAATYDGSAVSLYLNGELAGSVAASGDVYQPDMNFAVGGDPGAGDSASVVLDGKVSIARLYNDALSAEDIKKLYEEQADRGKLNEIDQLFAKNTELQTLLSSKPTDELKQLVSDIAAANGKMNITGAEIAALLVRANLLLADEQKNKLTFSVWSDVHINDEASIQDDKFAKALTTVNNMAPNLKAYIMVGDLANTGSQAQYTRFLGTLNKYGKAGVKKLYTMGNHDYWTDYYAGLSPEISQKRFTDNLGAEINSHEIIDGYHFIQVSTESNEVNGIFTKAKPWLKEELKKAAADAPDKPIFVSIHQPPKDTVYGSDDWGNSELYDVLKSYPQVITFSGHSHYALNDERSIYQKDFTSINDGALTYIELENGKLGGSIPPSPYDFNQGLLVEVDKTTNDVRVKRLDFDNDRVIKDDWIIESPGDKSKFMYTDARKEQSANPYFDNSAMLTVSDVKENSVKLTFDQGQDEDLVHSYKIQAINKATGVVEKEFLMFSDFYLDPRAKQMSTPVSGLKGGTEYIFTVTAIDSWGKESVQPLRGTATTKTSTDAEEGTDIPGVLTWAAETKNAPVIDGNLSDSSWKIKTPIEQLLKDSAVRENKANYGLLWDKDYLYVGVDIEDSKLVERKLWLGDEISVFIDANNDKKGSYEVPYDVQIGYGYTEDGSSKVFGFGGGSEGRNADDIKKAQKKTAKGWAVEMAIPWKSLGIDPQVNKSLGFDIGVDDNDGMDAFDSTLFWSKNETSQSWRTTEGFGTAMLYNTETPKADVFDFNFLDGKATDSSASKLNGEVVGDVKFEYDNSVKKHVAVFDGQSNNFIKIPFSQEQRDKVTKQFTLETVFKMNKIADMGVLMNTQGGGIGFESTDSGLMEIWAHIGGSYKRVGVQLEKDKYYHLAATYDGSIIKLYLDGKLVNSTDASGDVHHPDLHFALPGDPNPDGGAGAVLDGNISVGRLYSTALTSGQIKQVYTEYATRSKMVQIDQLLEMQKKLAGQNSEELKKLYEESGKLYTKLNVTAAEIEAFLSKCEAALKGETPVNHAPKFIKTANQEVNEDNKLTFQVGADDADSKVLTYRAENLPKGATFAADTRTFSWIPGKDQAGSYKVKFVVSDGSLTDEMEIVITVKKVTTGGSGDNNQGGGNSSPVSPSPTPSPTPVKPETKPSEPAKPEPSQETPKNTFKDLTNYGWAEKAITALAAKGIVMGTSETTFEPGKKITRADFIVLLVRALDLKAGLDSNFADVNQGDYYYQALGIAKKLGIANGMGGNLYNPRGEITRQDMMVLAAKALTVAGKLSEGDQASELKQFADADQVANYAAGSISSLIKHGIIKGNAGNTINPLGHANRAEAAVMVERMLQR